LVIKQNFLIILLGRNITLDIIAGFKYLRHINDKHP
jgi:hypothetical protein